MVDDLVSLDREFGSVSVQGCLEFELVVHSPVFVVPIDILGVKEGEITTVNLKSPLECFPFSTKEKPPSNFQSLVKKLSKSD